MLTDNIDLQGKTILITGVAGFIGAELAVRLLNEYPECKIVGIDNITDYYDVRLKYERLDELYTYGKRFIFIQDSIAEESC